MSTKTTFKRIALVAVAALGLGVLSVAPSSAAVSSLAIATTAGSAGNTAVTVTDTNTAGSVSVTALTTDATDTVSVTVVRKSAPTAGAAINARVAFAETATATTTVARAAALNTYQNGANYVAAFDSTTGFSTGQSSGYTIGGAVGYKNAAFDIFLETGTAPAAGSYVYTVIAGTYSGGAFVSQSTADVTITVAALASASKSVDGSKSSALITAGSTWGTLTDSAVSTLSTASSTVKAVIRVINNNSSSAAVAESITVTITGPGVARASGTTSAGKSITVVGDGNDDIEILSDGTAGTASIVVATTSITYPAKTVTFYAATPTTSVATVAKAVIEANATSTGDTVRVVIRDANGSLWAGDAYIYATSAASALIAGSETPSLCAFDPADARHECAVTGKTVGTAKFKVITSDSVTATTNVSSSEVEVRSANAVPASVKLVFDKATYAPGEKARLSVVLLDAAGAQIVGKTYDSILAAGGITPSIAFSQGSDTLTSTSVVVSATSSSTSGTTAGQQNYTVYMPYATGDITVTATGGTGLPVAARIATTATASVANSSVDAATDAANEATDAANAATDAALAAADAADAATAAAQDASDAVAALSATVAKLVASLKAQITSLTNLVIKIQKKVRA